MRAATIQNCTPPVGHCGSEWLTEASDLCLRPGCWPDLIPTTLGNGQPFVKARVLVTPDYEFAGMLYQQEFGHISLRVLND